VVTPAEAPKSKASPVGKRGRTSSERDRDGSLGDALTTEGLGGAAAAPDRPKLQVGGANKDSAAEDRGFERSSALAPPQSAQLPSAPAEVAKSSPRSDAVGKLHAQAAALAEQGDCAEARALVGKIRGLDADYYAAEVARDRRLAACLATKR
jgi:hypothetical protein